MLRFSNFILIKIGYKKSLSGGIMINTRLTRKRVIAIAITLLIIVGAIAIGAEVLERNQEKKANEVKHNFILNQAKEENITLLSEEQLTQIIAEKMDKPASDIDYTYDLDRVQGTDNPVYIFEVDVKDGFSEYDIEINAETGEVIDLDFD